MTNRDLIAIVTNQLDAAADGVVRELDRMGQEVIRLNSEEMPLHTTVRLRFDGVDWAGGLDLSISGRLLDADRVRSIWWRRPMLPVLPDDLEPWEREFARGEIRHALRGFYDSLDCFWVSHPDAIQRASWKPAQLKHAAALGFEVPRTIITTDPSVARRFYEDCSGRVIFKVFTGPYLGLEKYQDRYPEGPFPEVDLQANTLLIGPAELDQIDGIRTVPSMFQEYVEKAAEYRVTVIGDEVFSAEIESQSTQAAMVDSRLDLEGVLYRAAKLPAEVEAQCRRLVRDRGLEFSAIDLVRTPDDRFVFLESNPNGQFAYIEDLVPEFELNVAIANLLAQAGSE